jgi:hypothetical protein
VQKICHIEFFSHFEFLGNNFFFAKDEQSAKFKQSFRNFKKQLNLKVLKDKNAWRPS